MPSFASFLRRESADTPPTMIPLSSHDVQVRCTQVLAHSHYLLYGGKDETSLVKKVAPEVEQIQKEAFGIQEDIDALIASQNLDKNLLLEQKYARLNILLGRLESMFIRLTK